MEVWFSDKNSETLVIEDRIYITLIISYWLKIQKIKRYSVQHKDQIFLKSNELLPFGKKYKYKLRR